MVARLSRGAGKLEAGGARGAENKAVEYPRNLRDLSAPLLRSPLPLWKAVLTPEFALVLFAGAATLAVVGQLFVLRAALAGRTPSSVRSPAGRLRELLWIALPAFALMLVLVATFLVLPRRGATEIGSPIGPKPSARGAATT